MKELPGPRGPPGPKGEIGQSSALFQIDGFQESREFLAQEDRWVFRSRSGSVLLERKASGVSSNPVPAPQIIGRRGSAGPAGPKGDTGETGIQGVRGRRGSVGPPGPLGPIGEVGVEGPPGRTGETSKEANR